MSFDIHIPEGKLLILFDGDCLLCNSSVLFIIKRDPSERFVFATLDSNIGRTISKRFCIEKKDTLILFDGKKIYIKSDGILGIAKHLDWPWRWANIFQYVPQILRDNCYNLIAKNRHRLWGKEKQCWVGNKVLESRLLK